jgi:hypothetical protein
MTSFDYDRAVTGWDYSGPPHPSEERSFITSALIFLVVIGVLIGTPLLLGATGVISASGGCGGG